MSKLLINSCDGAYSSLDVRFTKYCDNACPFCVEKTGIEAMKMNVQEMVKSTITSGIKNVLILGGEPFLYPSSLIYYIKGIREHVDKIYITTSLPATFAVNPELCNEILDLIDGLNVSIQHYIPEVNNMALRASKTHNRIDILKELNKEYADKIRTSINLVAGIIWDKDSLTKCLKALDNIGCKNIKINELQNSGMYSSYEKCMGIKLPSPFAHGCQTSIKIEGIKANLILKRSCFMTESSGRASILDMAKAFLRIFIKSNHKFKVLYENGKIENGWLKKA
jgi:molybdenum cofactor biosynthesis enzyme MoaA